ncbi:Protein FAM195B [Fukomys damarensis]|uniref:Protein FAM195B n=1 Tax=Fukomys damarensis TaxID=885580 RepID=A0A091DZL8_FUKDA|nr:Protein FAM195B [Fukomys damarensis]
MLLSMLEQEGLASTPSAALPQMRMLSQRGVDDLVYSASVAMRLQQSSPLGCQVEGGSVTEITSGVGEYSSRVVYNGKRNSSPRSPTNSSEIFTPAHEENVRFIYEAWQGVERDLRSQLSGGERGLVEEYVEKVPNPGLKTFKPIDLSDLKRRNTQDTKKP